MIFKRYDVFSLFMLWPDHEQPTCQADPFIHMLLRPAKKVFPVSDWGIPIKSRKRKTPDAFISCPAQCLKFLKAQPFKLDSASVSQPTE